MNRNFSITCISFWLNLGKNNQQILSFDTFTSTLEVKSIQDQPYRFCMYSKNYTDYKKKYKYIITILTTKKRFLSSSHMIAITLNDLLYKHILNVIFHTYVTTLHIRLIIIIVILQMRTEVRQHKKTSFFSQYDLHMLSLWYWHK
jgi:hypothetical protein